MTPSTGQRFPWPENLLRRLALTAGGCVEFTGSRNRDGYGNVWVGGSVAKAHRAMYELMVGPIPDGLTVDHTCRNRACVNPAHLEPVPHAENVRRGRRGGVAGENQAKGHCPQGHPYDRINSAGRRICSTCYNAYQRAYQRRRWAEGYRPPRRRTERA